ncbi:sigma-E factor regulatory protein RseB domain-containing protein [Neobacillus mesonae]|uniref:LolA family protein n=1 Tax=Neobacillus mesonae TaxID=1193713 RepID=UPI00203D19B9|nr:sigma-E factor regulatory protein RseB domain-containing protein [Neobacillus mesonae]MCM3570521.1 hypothetical protein [Neobacillus mesonae]
MNQNEKRLSDYIDRLNDEQRPDEDEYSTDSEELRELFQTVKKVRSLKDPAMPGPEFAKKLAKSANKSKANKKKWTWAASITGIAAIIALMLNFLLPSSHTDIVYAMEKAFQDVKTYHGVLEIVETNKAGESNTQAKLEVWADQNGSYYIKNLVGPNKGMITVNNGEKKWQIQPKQKKVQILPVFPDTNRFTFELGTEISEVKQAVSTKTAGDDTIAGRKASILEVTPKGGAPYKIWVDKETNLPLQKQTAMQNAIQYKVTYTKMDFNETMPKELISYQIPKGYSVIDKNPEQFVNDLDEAKKAIGFFPKTLKTLPDGFSEERISVIPSQHLVKLYYSANSQKVMIIQRKSSGRFKAATNASLGKVGDNTAEIQSPIFDNTGILWGGGLYAGMTDVSSIRWQQDGFEYAIIGDVPLDKLVSVTKIFTNGTFELSSSTSAMKPQVEVPYDLTIEKNDQKSVDAGNSPWKLDAAFTAQVFVSLKISPEGINGDYPIDRKDLKVVQNTGTTAIVEVSSDKTPIKRVYLKRIVRQNSTGIWTVTGYDPVKK